MSYIQELAKKKILFVCTGNTCRSPMAAALFNRLATAGDAEYEALSAGLAAAEGSPATYNSQKAMEAYPGTDLSCHRSRRLSHADIEEAHLVLVMEKHTGSIFCHCIPKRIKSFYIERICLWNRRGHNRSLRQQ